MFRPDAAEIARLKARVEKQHSNEQLRDNHFYAGLYSRTDGIFSDVRKPSEWIKDGKDWIRIRHRLRRREWIEKFFPIRTMTGEIKLLTLNPAQRMLEAQILRMERARVPIRIIILKARQMGFSTYVQGLMFERVLRGSHIRGLIVADNKDRSETLLAMAQIARTKMVKDRNAGTVWNFRLTSKARDVFRFDEPMHGEVEVTTAEAPSAGIGGTRNILHLSESPRWKRPDQTYSDCLSSLPTIPNSYGFDEATAYGARGRFHDDFWKAWNEREVPLFDRENTWSSTFFAWWQHPEYFWTQSYGSGRELPESMVAAIKSTQTVEEDWLLKQEYLRRWKPEDEWERVRCHNNYDIVMEGNGSTAKIVEVKRVRKDTWVWRRKGVGWQPVGYDQLAWRRTRIADKHFGGDMDLFNQDYPSRPRLAFLSSGRPVFPQDLLTRMMDNAKKNPPLFRGTLRKKLEQIP